VQIAIEEAALTAVGGPAGGSEQSRPTVE
jgi:hypothetical protein